MGKGTGLKLLALGVALGACGWVFAAWMNPHLAVEVANLVRSCF